MKAETTVKIPEELMQFLDMLVAVYEIPPEKLQIAVNDLLKCGVLHGIELFKEEMREKWSNMPQGGFVN